MPDPTEVLVVGAGPAGSATALHLARLGHSVRLLDRAPFPRDKPCAEYLSPAAVRELESCLPSQSIASRGAAITGTNVLTPQGGQLSGRFGGRASPPGLALPRHRMDAMLVAEAVRAGVMLEPGRVSGVIGFADGLRHVTSEDGQGVVHDWHARVIVGADGLGSRIARHAGMHRQGWLRRIAFSAHLRGISALHHHTEMHVAPGGYVGLNRLGPDLCNVSLVVRADHARAARGDAEGFLRRQLDAIPLLRDRVRQATVAREVLTTGPFHASCRRSTGDGMLLVGDAAEFFDPFTGDGIYSALVGARLAAATLHEALQQPGPIMMHHLAAYRRARVGAFLGKWGVERLIGFALQAPRLFHHAVTRIERRGMADTLVGATGHEISPWQVLNPVFLARMLL